MFPTSVMKYICLIIDIKYGGRIFIYAVSYNLIENCSEALYVTKFLLLQ